jgi:acid phosphatase
VSLSHARKILVITEENHSIKPVFPDGMPCRWSLAQRYAYATDWSDVSHPSLPNYLAIFAGSAFNNPQDCELPGVVR